MALANYSLASPEEIEEITGMPVPTEEAAAYELRDLAWGEQLTCVDMSPSVGNSTIRFYGLAEAARFMGRGTGGTGYLTGGDGSIAWVELDRLTAWARTVLDDEALASALEREAAPHASHHERVRTYARLLGMRCAQLQGVLERAE